MTMPPIDVKLTREGTPYAYNNGYVHCAMTLMIFRHFHHFYQVEFLFASGKDPHSPRARFRIRKSASLAQRGPYGLPCRLTVPG